MAGGEDGNIVDGDGHLNQPITHLQFNALRDHLRREFRTDLEAIEEKQDQMTKELQQLMRNVNDQLHQNMTAMRANLVAEIVRELRQVPEYASAHGGEQRGTNEDAAASNARERRHHAAPLFSQCYFSCFAELQGCVSEGGAGWSTSNAWHRASN